MFSDDSQAKNYKTWLNSAIIIMGSLGIIGVVLLFLESKFVTPLAIKFCSGFSVQISIWQLMKELRKKAVSRTTRIVSFENISALVGSSNSSGSNSIPGYSSEESSQISAMKASCSADSSIKKAFEDNKEANCKPIGAMRFFWIVFATQHFILAIFTSKSTNYSRKSLILMVFLRIACQLSFTTFLVMGMDRTGFTTYQDFFIKFFLVPVAVGAALMVLKKMIHKEGEYGMSMINWRPTKAFKNTPSANTSQVADVNQFDEGPRTPLRQTNPTSVTMSRTKRVDIRTGTSQLRQPSSLRIGPKRAEIINKPDLSRTNSGADSPVTPQTATHFSNNASEPTNKSPVAETQGTLPSQSTQGQSSPLTTPKRSGLAWVSGLLLIVVGYVLSFATMGVCFLLLFSVVSKNNDTLNWPFGSWFIVQTLYQTTLGQVVSTFMQIGLFKLHLAYRLTSSRKFPQSCFKKNFLLNTDVLALAEPLNKFKPSK